MQHRLHRAALQRREVARAVHPKEEEETQAAQPSQHHWAEQRQQHTDLRGGVRHPQAIRCGTALARCHRHKVSLLAEDGQQNWPPPKLEALT